LINKKEHAVTFRKIQAVAWKTNWIRRYFGFWMLEYRIAGGNEVGGKMRVQVPVTHASHLPGLINAYHPMPDGLPADPVHMHPTIIVLRMLITGMISVLLLSVSWPWWEFASLVFLLLPLYTAFYTFLQQRKFRMWVMEDSICLMRGAYGTEMALLQWNKIQAISLKQSSFQRKRTLATLILYTASDNFTIRFIPLPAAQAIMNYGLYKIESSREGWM
jgi:putative membrane protein